MQLVVLDFRDLVRFAQGCAAVVSECLLRVNAGPRGLPESTCVRPLEIGLSQCGVAHPVGTGETVSRKGIGVNVTVIVRA